MKNPSYKDLEAVKNHETKHDYSVNISIPEFTCLCPRTGLPDFAIINIEYIPSSNFLVVSSLSSNPSFTKELIETLLIETDNLFKSRDKNLLTMKFNS